MEEDGQRNGEEEFELVYGLYVRRNQVKLD